MSKRPKIGSLIVDHTPGFENEIGIIVGLKDNTEKGDLYFYDTIIYWLSGYCARKRTFERLFGHDGERNEMSLKYEII